MNGNSIDPLSAICDQIHPVADLARAFLARGTEWSIDEWFLQRAKTYFQDQDAEVDREFSLENLTYPMDSAAPRIVRVLSIRPFYFRGFQELEHSIGLDADLVTVDGRNSSGKTSLAEAIEWLLSGKIQRREHGDPNELADFIANRFRPKGQKTWVECNLAVDGETIELKRVLIDDYGTTKNSNCTSRLFINGIETEDLTDLLADYFSGVAPLLMQHTLREFVLEAPGDRPKYFERLLNIDEISDLIAAAQVSNLRKTSEFPRHGGGTALADWQQFTQLVGQAHFLPVEQYSKLDRSVLRKEICNTLVRVAVEVFDAKCEFNLHTCVTVVNSLQEGELQCKFPALEDFRPRENLTQSTFVQFSPESHNPCLQRLEQTRTDFVKFLESQDSITDAKISIVKAFEELRNSKLIRYDDKQVCPLCEYQQVPTLTRGRIDEIESWDPLREDVERAKERFEGANTECHQTIGNLKSLREKLVPPDIPQISITHFNESADSDHLEALLAAHSNAQQNLQAFDQKTSVALQRLDRCDPNLDSCDALRDVFSLVPILQNCAEEYAREYEIFWEHLNELASSDEEYKARDSWLSISQNLDKLILDFQWETAKSKSREELEFCRDLLIAARQKYLASRRNALNDGITGIWSKLRRDSYSAFSELVIPEPRGRGQKARIEVKVKLSGRSGTQEVHALSVLSESQINAIGIAAFVTRSKLLGHSVLVFDDPVQSMDNDHFKSFAGDVLSYLCDNGFQVIILTHNDDFAQVVTCSHSDRESRISMEIQHTRKRGISVSEGNRSVTGLLKLSNAYWENGEFDAAWVRLRIAIERQYTLIRMKSPTQQFEWRKWKRLSAEKMWKNAVESLVLPLFPDCAQKLPRVVFMTGGGAHSRQADGETDFRWAVEVIRELQSKIQVGD